MATTPRVTRPSRLGHIVATAAAFALLAGAASAQAPLKIGAVMPITGPAAAIGFTHQLGSSMAIKEINASGGIMGRQVQLLIADDQGDPTQSVNEVKRLILQEKVELMLGPIISHLVLAAAPILTEAKVANIHTGGAATITPQVLPYGFSMFTSTDQQIKSMVRYAAEVAKVKSAAILTDTSAISKAAHEPLRAELAARNIRITGVQEHEARTPDLTPQILGLRRGNPEIVLFLTVTGEDAGLAVKTLKDVGWDVPIVSPTFANVTPVVLKVAGPDAFKSGKVIGQTYKTFTYCPGDPVGASPFAKFLEKLKAAEPAQYDRIATTTVSWLYDGAFILKAAVEATKGTDGVKIAQWIEGNAGTIRGRISGDVSASRTQHFLISADSLELVSRSDERRADGLVRRAGC